MAYDEDPKEHKQSFQCSKCDKGNVTFNHDTGYWECDNCEFARITYNGTFKRRK